MIVTRSRQPDDRSLVRRLVDIERVYGGHDRLSRWELVQPEPFDIDDAEIFDADLDDPPGTDTPDR